MINKLKLLLISVIFIPYLSYSQNIVLSVTGKAMVNGQSVKKGDNLANNAKVVFGNTLSELKILSPVGVCVIKYKNYEEKKSSELLDLIKSSIRKNSVATLGTRAWKVNPSAKRQVELVDSMCKILNVNSENVNEIFSRYITPYCVLEFEKPYWQDIAAFLQTKYSFKLSYLTGELMTSAQYQRVPLVPKSRSFVSLPQAASLKKYCPIPGDQGQYGTCTGWASAYAARTISWAVKNNLTDLLDITNQAFSPSFVYAQCKALTNDINCSGGGYIDKSAEVLKNAGSVFLTDLPYGCNIDITPFYQLAKTYAIKDYQRLTESEGLTDADFDNIKQALAANKPVLCSIKCYKSFMNSWWGGKIWNGITDNMKGNHAICMIGYDNNYNNGDGTTGAVEFMNSWSPLWADGGFIHVKYQDLPKILNSALSLYDEARPLPPPEPPKPLPVPPAPDTLNRMEGSFKLILINGTSMPVEGDASTFRGLKLAANEKMTYNISNSYTAGTMFRINFTSSKPAYVYVISTDSKRSPMAQLFPDPDRNISALLDFNSEVSVSIPDETQYIAMDETAGEDYLCVIYSKEELDISQIQNSFDNNPDQSFVKAVKNALADQIVDDSEVTFDKNKIAFKAASPTHTAVPIFIKIKHI